MYSKLALRNVKKSFRDYAIYFLTLMFGVCIFYVFNSIDAQQSMMIFQDSQISGIETLQMIMGYISVFISVILGFLIVYANRFLVRRRKKELGIYQVLGMEKGQIGRILTIETLVVAVLSLAAGLGLGILISQGFAVLTASLFDVKLAAGFRFIFSSSATLKAILYFGIAFLLVVIFNRITVGKQKLIDLLNAQRKNEKFRTPHLALSVIIFIVSTLCLGIAYYIVEKDGAHIGDRELLSAVILGVVGTFMCFFSLSGFFLKVVQQNKKVYFKGLNMFVLRQINSKITTAFVSISMVCLMLFLSICALSFGMGFSKTITADLEWLNPYDLNCIFYISEISKNGNTDEDEAGTNLIQVNLTEELNNVQIPIEDYAKNFAELSLHDVPPELLDYDEYMFGNYITLSDFNEVLKTQGKEPMTLEDNEFILNCLDEEHRNKYIEYFKNNNVHMQNIDLSLKAVDDTVLYNALARGNYNCVHVLPDKLLAESEVYANVLLINYKEQTEECEKLCREATEEMQKNLENSYQTSEKMVIVNMYVINKSDIFKDSKSTAVTVAYLAVYLGVIFAVVSAVVLAITQLSEASDNTHRYGLLRKLGADSKMINKALFWQIAIYFCVPLLLAIIHAIFGLRFANDLITQVGKSNILRDSVLTAVVLITVYGGYFLATYFGSKRIIGNK